MKQKILLWVFLLCFLSTNLCAEESIRIALVADISSKTKADQYTIDGVHYAVDEINSEGGVLGKKIELVLFDNLGSPIISKAVAKKIAKTDIVAVIGAPSSSHSLPIAKILQKHKIPMIASVSTHPDITKTGDYIFRVCFTDTFQGKAMAEFVVNKLKAKTVVTIRNLSSDYSVMLADVFVENFEKVDGEILLELKYVESDKESGQMLSKMKGLSPDVIFIPTYEESALIITKIQKMGIGGIPVGGDGWGGDIFERFGASQIKKAYYSTHWSEEMNDEYSRAFVKRYKKDEVLFADTALAYDAVCLLVDAIRRAGSVEREKIRDAIANTKGYSGVTGNITFDETGDPIKSVVVMQIIDGKTSYLETIEPKKE